MATLLTCREVSKTYGLRRLFAGLSLSIADDEHVGFIGPNGSGKTTFLKMLAGLEAADSGEVSPRRSARIAYVPQQDLLPAGATARSVLAEALGDLRLEPHELDTRVNITLSRFGFDRQHEYVDQLSGGWRKRLALAREMIREPDLLLMDEPTNHLDIEGVEWLEELLRGATFAFLVVSHDRYFLDRVTNRVVELNPAYPSGYFSVAGPYSKFLEKRAEFLEAQQAQQVSLASIVRREVAFLKSNSKAQRTKSKSRIEEAYQLQDELRELQDRNAQETSASIEFTGTGRKTRTLLAAQGLSKSLGGRLLFEDVSVTLSPGTRLGLLGSNGSGKTTLIRVLTGSLPADAGTIKRADNLRVVLFDQKREDLPQDAPLRLALSSEGDHVSFQGRPVHVTAWAKRFLFSPHQLDMPVGGLSGGEQARVLIARLMLRPADVLLLDEPTNDLDISSLDVLEENLCEFAGAVVLVTHDRFMLDRVCTEVVGLDGQGHALHCADRAQWQAAQARLAKAPDAGAIPSAHAGKTQQPAGKGSIRKGLTASEKKDLEEMESRIEAAEKEVERCRQALDDPLLASDYVETEQRWKQLEAARNDVDALYARWQELESKANRIT